MTTSKVTLVLGAGASVPYGFPTAASLKEQLLELPKTGIGRCATTVGVPEAFIRDFLPLFQNSAWSSIDRFLRLRSDQSDLGKKLIAYVLLGHEQRVRKEQGMLYRGKALDLDWYGFLFNQILAPSSAAELVLRMPRVVTFNYDRSLEWFLLSAFMANWRLSEGQALELLEQIEIVHIHGTVGRSVRDFGAKDGTFERLCQAPTSLRLLTDDLDNSEAVKAARRYIQTSRVVVAIGFGFDEENATRIGLPALPDGTPVYASGYGMTPVEQRAVRRALGGMPRTFGLGDPDMDALAFLRSNSAVFED